MRGAREDGFTLVEALAALVILSGVAMAAYQAFGGGWRGAAIADGEADAVMLAEARLAEVGRLAPLAAGRSAGRSSSGHDWVVEVEPYRPSGGASLEPGVAGREVPTAFWVSVTIDWRPAPGASARSVRLKTLKLVEERR